MNTARKLDPKQSKEKDKRPDLRLVQNTPAQHTDSFKILVLFLAIAGALLSAVIYVSTSQPFYLKKPAREFLELHNTYREKGLKAFQEQKSFLKSQVSQILRSDVSTLEKDEAQNIAVFLFPDILPDSNFEKQEGEELWLTHQKAIEATPHSPQGRVHFEEMRANIWNYENPNKNVPRLSKQARQVLRIYDALSAN